MPTYRYRCARCEETFERVESLAEHGTAKPRCPTCGGETAGRSWLCAVYDPQFPV